MRACFAAGLLSLGLAAVGCSNADLAGTAKEADSATSDTSAPEADSNDEEALDSAPMWFTPDGTLEVVDGQLVAAELQVRVYGSDLSLPALCVRQLMAEGIEVQESTPDETVFTWWELDLAEADEPCADDVVLPDSLLPSQMALGLGAMHEEVTPGVARSGLEVDAQGLYGAYVNFTELSLEAEQQTAFVFGFAGTSTDRSGDSQAVTEGPLPDGLYHLTGFYLFPIE